MHDPKPMDREAAPDWPVDDALDRALAASLRAPDLPTGFRAGLQLAIERAADQALRERRAQIDAERMRGLADLQAGYLRVRRDVLAMVVAAAFAAGAVATVVLPPLAQALDMQASTLAPLLAVLVGLGTGAAVWVERLGLPRWR